MFIRCCRIVAIGLLMAAGLAGPARGQAPEEGHFRLHKFLQAIGDERYHVTQDGDVFILSDSFAFTDRGSRVPLRAMLRFGRDHTPQAFAVHGRSSRSSTLDDSVTIAGGIAMVQVDSSHSTSIPIGQNEAVFTIAGYAPVAIQQELMRYWLAHGRPATIRALPSGNTIRITARGRDTVRVGDAPVVLQRYGVTGLIWGRESLWMDDAGFLAALVSTDAEFDHFEAVRNEYEGSLTLFVSRAGNDGAEALAQLVGPRAMQESFALVGATLIDGTGGALISDAVVVVKNGRITAAGPRTKVRIPGGTRRIDVTGKYIVPGLFDMHAHYEQVEWGPIYLAAGVTTARDVGNEFAFITAVRDAIKSGRGIGPRILTAGIIDGSGPFGLGVDRADTPEEAARLVQRYHDAGFDQIKTYSSVSLKTLTAIAAEAHRLGITVTGHIPTGLDAFQGVEAGMDQINHIPYIVSIMKPKRVAGKPAPALDLGSPEAERALAFLKEHHTVIDPTLVIYEEQLRPARVPYAELDPGAAKVAPELREQIRNSGASANREAAAKVQFDEMLAVVGALHKAGIPIVAGTDQSIPGHSLHRELELYVKAGFTPMEALQAGTSVPAAVMHLDTEVGTVTAGKRADILVVDGNPLDRIENLRKIFLIVADGRRYDPAPLWRVAGFLP